MGTLSLTLGIGAANGFVLAAVLHVSRRGRPASRILACLIAALSWRAGTYILGYAGAYDAHPWLTFFPFDLSLAYGPLLWFYVTCLTRGQLPPRWRSHLFPAGVQLLYLCLCFALPQEAKWDWYTGPHLHAIAPAGAAAALLSGFLYLHRSLRQAARYQAWLDSAYANHDEARLGDLRFLLRAFGVALLIATAFAFTSWFLHPLDYVARFPLMAMVAVLIYCLGILGWRNTAIAFPPPPSPSAVEEAEPAPLLSQNGEDAIGPSNLRREQARRMQEIVVASAWWRDEELDLRSLACRLGVSERTLSRTLSEGLETNFREFVGRLRVEAIAAELDRADDTRSILDIAMAAGFKSKASFNRAFLAYRGTTPSAYRAAAATRRGIKSRQSPDAAASEAT